MSEPKHTPTNEDALKHTLQWYKEMEAGYARAIECFKACEDIANPAKTIPALAQALREIIRTASPNIEGGTITGLAYAAHVEIARKALRAAGLEE